MWAPTPQLRGITKVAICAIGRNENPYAVEWVEHYKKMGMSKLFIYDNWFGNETPLADTLKDYVGEGFVEITPVPNVKDAQCRCYEDCYHKHKNGVFFSLPLRGGGPLLRAGRVKSSSLSQLR